MPRSTTRKNHVSWVKARRETARFNLIRHMKTAKGKDLERMEAEKAVLDERIKYGSAA